MTSISGLNPSLALRPGIFFPLASPCGLLHPAQSSVPGWPLRLSPGWIFTDWHIHQLRSAHKDLTPHTQNPVRSQNGMACRPSPRRIETAPRPLARMLHQSCPDRIQDHITADLKQIPLLLNQDRLEPTLKEMADSLVPPVEPLGVDSVKLPHPGGKPAIHRLDHQMIMVGHQAVSMAPPVVALIDVPEQIEEVASIGINAEDGAPLIPAGRRMVDRPSY